MGTFTELWTTIKAFFSASWVVIYPFIAQFMSEAGALALQMAPSVVAVIEETMGQEDGAAKRQEAFNRILAAFEAQGIKIAASVIYSAIEAAVAKMRATPAVVEQAKQLQMFFSQDHPVEERINQYEKLNP
jgi:LL-H family phage holin